MIPIFRFWHFYPFTARYCDEIVASIADRLVSLYCIAPLLRIVPLGMTEVSVMIASVKFVHSVVLLIVSINFIIIDSILTARCLRVSNFYIFGTYNVLEPLNRLLAVFNLTLVPTVLISNRVPSRRHFLPKTVEI